MIRMLLHRLPFLILQLAVISFLTFAIVRMLPGDPARLQLGPLAPQETVDALRQELNLDKSIFAQYIAYIGKVLHGDFGRSYVNGTEVANDIAQRLPATIELLLCTFIAIVVIFIPWSIVSVAYGDSLIGRTLKRASRVYGFLAGALPDFFLALALIFIFFYLLGWLPGPEGRLGLLDMEPDRVTGLLIVDSLLAGDVGLAMSAAAHLVLPVATLAFVYGGPILKMLLSSMDKNWQSDQVQFARLLGLSKQTQVLFAFKISAGPTVVMAGVVAGYLLGGAVLIESIFNLNGIGQYAVQAIIAADYAPIQAFVLIAVVYVMLVYLAVDVVFGLLDPRVRQQQ